MNNSSSSLSNTNTYLCSLYDFRCASEITRSRHIFSCTCVYVGHIAFLSAWCLRQPCVRCPSVITAVLATRTSVCVANVVPGIFPCHAHNSAHFHYTGWEGNLCDIRSDDCVNNECTNGATCIDGRRRYTCECREGFTGK